MCNLSTHYKLIKETIKISITHVLCSKLKSTTNNRIQSITETRTVERILTAHLAVFLKVNCFDIYFIKQRGFFFQYSSNMI